MNKEDKEMIIKLAEFVEYCLPPTRFGSGKSSIKAKYKEFLNKLIEWKNKE